MTYLNKQEASNLQQVLLNHSQSFFFYPSNNGILIFRWSPIKFSSDYMIKALPFLIPQALQEARKTNQSTGWGKYWEKCLIMGLSHVTCKKKSDGEGQQKYRMALDPSLLKIIIEHSSYPLRKIQNLISNIANFMYFTFT